MRTPSLVAEATRRSGVVWVGGALLWQVWHDGAMYVVGGGPEQALPVAPGDRVTVAVRSKTAPAGLLVEWDADVQLVEVGTPQWDEVLPLLAAERLNAEAGRADRWATECTVLRFVPLD